MVANAGYKAYATGDVLTAAQVQYNLQNQTVMYFATSAARTTAIGAVTVEGMVTYIPANGLEYYNGSAWITLSTGGDITGVTAGTGITGGGTSGTVTVTNDMATTITAAGDLIRGTGSGTYSRLGIGSTGQVLSVSGGQPAWTTPASGGGMTLLSTTSLSGTSTTISSISGSYTSLFVYGYGITGSAACSFFYRVNGLTTGIYYDGLISDGNVTFTSSSGGVMGTFIDYLSSSGNNASVMWSIPLYASTSSSFKIGNNQGNGPTTRRQLVTTGVSTSAAISSITILTNSAATMSGTILIYGVN